MSCFVAIDFETADHSRASACAVALVRVEQGAVMGRHVHLIHPGPSPFTFSYLHGITAARVAGQPGFAELWPRIRGLLRGAEFLAAHNAAFDRSVLRACCDRAGLTMPKKRWLCTVELARSKWGIRPTKLPDVCRRLGIALDHHDPLSDAEACARIVLAAGGAG